jgi:hypothetical protein
VFCRDVHAEYEVLLEGDESSTAVALVLRNSDTDAAAVEVARVRPNHALTTQLFASHRLLQVVRTPPPSRPLRRAGDLSHWLAQDGEVVHGTAQLWEQRLRTAKLPLTLTLRAPGSFKAVRAGARLGRLVAGLAVRIPSIPPSRAQRLLSPPGG